MKIISRIWLPVTVFVAFLITLLNRRDIYHDFLENGRFVSESFFSYGIQIGAWVSSTFLLNRLITLLFWDGFIGKISDRRVPRLPKDVTAIILFSITALIIASTVFNKDTTKILAASGAVSIVIGLALRTIILDLFMGLAIHVDQPFKIGDWIMVHQNRVETHITAEVIETNWRTTRLRTTKNNMVVVPNSRLGDTIVTNYMKPKPHFRMEVDFTLDFDVSSERATRVLTAGIRAACEHEGVLVDPEPEVRMKASTLEGMVYEIRYFILPKYISPNESMHLVNNTVLDHLIHSGIVPALSKQEVFLSKREKRSLDASLDNDLYQLLTRTELFRSLSAEEFNSLLEKMTKRTLREGESLYHQEETASSMFVCVEGLLISHVDGIEVGQVKAQTIRAGQHFGEGALLGGQLRESTITSSTESLLYEINRNDFDPILAKHQNLEKYLESTHFKSIEEAREAVDKATESAKSKPEKKKTTAINKVMRLWPKKRPPKQTFFPEMVSEKNESKEKES